jgi:hypothetical protein
MTHRALPLLLVFTLFHASAENAQVTVPVSVSFYVLDLAASTPSASNPVVVSFQAAQLESGRVLKVSLRPVANQFSSPGGATIPASRVRWTVNGATNGTGFAGTADSASFITVFRSNVQATSGSFSLNFTLDAPGSGVLATAHTLDLQWSFESEPQ